MSQKSHPHVVVVMLCCECFDRECNCVGGCVCDPDAKPGPMASALCRCGGVICGSGSLSEDESEDESEEDEEEDGET